MAVTTTKYTTLDGEILSVDVDGASYNLLPDPQGNVVAQISDTGTVTNPTAYWPYGEVRTGGTGSLGFGGSWGYYTDSTIGIYIRARVEDIVRARWTTVDPLWPAEHAYLLVGCTPVTAVDPTGTQYESAPGILIGKPTADILCCIDAARDALRDTPILCKSYDIGKPGGDGLCNALQHCLWACYAAQRCGVSVSISCTNMHEEDAPSWFPNCPGYRPLPKGKYVPNPPRLKCMDLYNNRVGVNCHSALSCENCCLQHLKSGDVQVIDMPIKLPPGWRRPKTDCKSNWRGAKLPAIEVPL